MKNLKPLCIAVSFLFFSSTLFSQIKPVNKFLKVDNVSKTDIKLKDYILSNNALKVDEIEGLSVEDIEGLKIPKVTPVDLEVLNSIKLKESWEVSPKQLNDGALTFENMSSGIFSFNDGFKLKPQVFFRKISITYMEDISPSKLAFSFKQREGDMYLLEIPVIASAGTTASVFPQPHFSSEELDFVTIGRNGDYQTHQIVGGKVTTVWTAEYTGEVDFKILQKIPETELKPAILSCVTKIKSIKIRNITE